MKYFSGPRCLFEDILQFPVPGPHVCFFFKKKSMVHSFSLASHVIEQHYIPVRNKSDVNICLLLEVDTKIFIWCRLP